MNNFLNKIPNPIKWGVVFLVILFGWLYFTKGVNGISNFFFWRQANKQQAAVEEKLKKAEQQQAVIDQTLRDLAAANAKLEEAKKATDKAVEIFNDSSKTSKEKVAEFKETMSSAPTHTDPGGVTNADLCARAKAANSNPELIAALCGQ